MTNRYSRHQAVINREKDAHIDDDYWFKQFEKNLEKSAVTSKRIDDSLYSQINSIMNTKSKHTSVSAAVEDMMRRSGLTAYLSNVKTSEDTTNKKASEEEVKKNYKNPEPLIFSHKEGKNVLNFLKNRIQSTKGSTSISALKETARSVFHNTISEDKYWEDPNLTVFINNLISQEKNKHSHETNSNNNNLGKIDINLSQDSDPSNNDAFHILMPAVK